MRLLSRIYSFRLNRNIEYKDRGDYCMHAEYSPVAKFLTFLLSAYIILRHGEYIAGLDFLDVK